MATKKKKKITKKAASKKRTSKVKLEVNAKNADFMALPARLQRVRIAEDVISQLRLKKFKARNGVFLGNNDPKIKNLDFNVTQADLGKGLDKFLAKKKCQGCAVGSLFMCAVEQADAIKVQDLSVHLKDNVRIYGGAAVVPINWDNITKYLVHFFSIEQLTLIEAAFERGEGVGVMDGRVTRNRIDHNKLKQARLFLFEIDEFCQSITNSRYIERSTYDTLNPTDSLRLIMENIVANKGTFDPSKKPKLSIEMTTQGY